MSSVLYARKKGRPVSLTALVDVVFILLLFFMLTSSFNRNTSIDFQSPVASLHASKEKPQMVKLYTNGGVSIYGENNPLLHDEEIRAHLNIHKPTIILSEPNVDVQSIIFTLEKLSNLGIEQLSLGKSLPSPSNNDGATQQ